jgi:hypothetical protein
MDFEPKRVAERIYYGVDFVTDLGSRPGVTILSAVWRNDVAFGVDPNPMAMISGQASIVGSVVSQLIINGVANVGYFPKCDATLSNGEVVTLPNIGNGLLLVRP